MRYKFVKTPDPKYVETLKEAEYWRDIYESAECIGFDTETTGLSKTGARVKFFSLSDGESRICAPVRLLPVFAGVLEDPSITMRMTNSKFDMHMVANHGIHIRGVLQDTVAMDWLIDENRRGRHGLKQTSADYLGLRMASFKEVFGSVGAVTKEIEVMCRMHDALEEQDVGLAVELLSLVGRVYGDESVVADLKKVGKARSSEKKLTSTQLLSIARRHELCPKTSTRMGYVSDFSSLVGLGPVDKEDRVKAKWYLTNDILISDAHDILFDYLGTQIEADIEPLEMIKLMVADYASLDAWGSYTLVDVMSAELCKMAMHDTSDETLLDYYYSVVDPFLRTLWNMERRGIKVDIQGTEDLRIPMKKDIDQLEREIVRIAGWGVNANSAKQLRELFYRKDGRGDWIDPFGERPKFWSSGGTTGIKNPSTSKAAIAEWASKGNELAIALQEHRILSKLHNTYLTGLPLCADSRGRIHTDLKATGTVTGRLSSGDPNLQNIPSRGDWGAKIRKLFVAGTWGECIDHSLEELSLVDPPKLARGTSMTLIVADYEQLEMRIMAHMSQDQQMIETIRSGKDLHSMTASLAGGYDYDEIMEAKKADDPTKQQKELIEVRAQMKAVGFGLLYGIGAAKLGHQLGLDITTVKRRNGRTYEKCPEAQDLIEKYFSIYPQVKAFIDDTHILCEDRLFVQTVRGRYRRLPDILSDDKGVASMTRRQSVNSIIQGSAADIAIQAMLNCESSEALRLIGVRMLLQIHDELVFEVPNIPETIETAKDVIKELMEDPIPMSVPIPISMDCANSWGEAK